MPGIVSLWTLLLNCDGGSEKRQKHGLHVVYVFVEECFVEKPSGALLLGALEKLNACLLLRPNIADPEDVSGD